LGLSLIGIHLFPDGLFQRESKYSTTAGSRQFKKAGNMPWRAVGGGLGAAKKYFEDFKKALTFPGQYSKY
jgi:hypothetical protein